MLNGVSTMYSLLIAVLFLCGKARGEAGSGGIQSIADFQRFINQNKITSIEQLLSVLPQTFKKQFVAMEESRSRHMADPDHPRVILYDYKDVPYGRSAFFFAMSTHPEDPRKNVIEMGEFDPKNAKWNLGQLNFDEPPHFPRKIDLNPRECQGCHGSSQNDYHPAWEPYPFWPGAVGENEFLSDEEIQKLQRYSDLRNQAPTIQKELAKKDIASKRREELQKQLWTHGRLSHLDFEKYIKDPNKRTAARDFHERVIEENNDRRKIRLIRNSPHYSYMRYAIAAGLYGCPDIPSFIPKESTLIVGGQKLWNQYHQDTLDKQKTLRKVREERKAKGKHGHINFDNDVQVLTNLRFLFESRGISIEEWETNFRITPYHIVDPFSGLFGSLSFRDRVLDNVLPLDRGNSKATMKASCAKLKELSHQALRELQRLPNGPQKVPGQNHQMLGLGNNRPQGKLRDRIPDRKFRKQAPKRVSRKPLYEAPNWLGGKNALYLKDSNNLDAGGVIMATDAKGTKYYFSFSLAPGGDWSIQAMRQPPAWF